MRNATFSNGKYTIAKSRRRKLIAVALIAGLGLSACQTDGQKEKIGGATGAILGGALGSQIGGGTGQLIAVGIGALVGGIFGSSLGRSLDEMDRQQMHHTAHMALETQPDLTTSSWVNPNSGNSGTITPQTTYQANTGEYCRDYTQTVTIDGQREEAYGTACRQPDGSWEIVS